MKKFAGWLLLIAVYPGILWADSEVIQKSPTQVFVREHPRTGKPYVVISAAGENKDPFLGQRRMMKRPDYRILDPKIKSGQVLYEGPVSDRKKIYILAASLATIGTVGGAGIIAAAPAATGTGAAGGAGILAGAGAGVAAGTLGGTYAASKNNSGKEDFTHVSESHAVKSQT